MSISDIYMAGTEEGKSANRKTDLAVTNWVSGANPLLRWIPGVFITPGTYHIYFASAMQILFRVTSPLACYSRALLIGFKISST